MNLIILSGVLKHVIYYKDKKLANGIIDVSKPYNNKIYHDFIPICGFNELAKDLGNVKVGSKIVIFGRFNHQAFKDEKGKIKNIDNCVVNKFFVYNAESSIYQHMMDELSQDLFGVNIPNMNEGDISFQ